MEGMTPVGLWQGRCHFVDLLSPFSPLRFCSVSMEWSKKEKKRVSKTTEIPFFEEQKKLFFAQLKKHFSCHVMILEGCSSKRKTTTEKWRWCRSAMATSCCVNDNDDMKEDVKRRCAADLSPLCNFSILFEGVIKNAKAVLSSPIPSPPIPIPTTDDGERFIHHWIGENPNVATFWLPRKFIKIVNTFECKNSEEKEGEKV